MEINEIRGALSHVDAYDRDTWVRLGMAVKSELGDAGFGVWDDWSKSAENYDAKAARSVWRSIREHGGVTIRTLVAEARAAGWSGDATAAPRRPPAQRQEDAERDAKAQRAAQRAQELVDAATIDTHPYLRDKGLPDASGLVLADSALFVPMRNWKTNALQGGQAIRADGDSWGKKMLPGMRAKGAVLKLGKGREAILCEGYATGLTIEMAAKRLCLDACVVVCFSAGNLTHVGDLMPGRRYVFADHDDAGMKAAEKLPYCVSPREREDANDLYLREGLMAVCKLLMEVRKK